MKKMKRFVAVLLAAVMALSMLTACSGGGAADGGNPEFEARVEAAYMDLLNEAFETELENDKDIQALAVQHLTETKNIQKCDSNNLWKATQGAGTITEVMACFDAENSTNDTFTKLYYEEATSATITADRYSVATVLLTAGILESQGGYEVTGIGVGAKTFGGKTYVAIGFKIKKAAQ